MDHRPETSVSAPSGVVGGSHSVENIKLFPDELLIHVFDPLEHEWLHALEILHVGLPFQHLTLGRVQECLRVYDRKHVGWRLLVIC